MCTSARPVSGMIAARSPRSGFIDLGLSEYWLGSCFESHPCSLFHFSAANCLLGLVAGPISPSPVGTAILLCLFMGVNKGIKSYLDSISFSA